MGYQNRQTMWKYLKSKLCPMSQNQVAPLAIINVQENNYVANEAQSEAKEILSVGTMTVTIMAYMTNLFMVSQLNVTDTVLLRNMMSLAGMAITHTVWIVISQKLRQFSLQLFTDIRGWISIYTP